MSLINDALKRAKKAQQDNPPPAPQLQLRPAETLPPRSSGPVILLVVALVVVLIVGGLLLWTFTKQSAPALRVDARTMTLPAPVVTEVPKVNDAPSTKADAVIPPTTGQSAATLVTDETLPGQPQTNGLPVVTTVEPPKPATLKLQAILYNPSRPSALINGKTVFQGDRVGDSRVLTITPEGVTLGSAMATNVLTLGE